MKKIRRISGERKKSSKDIKMLHLQMFSRWIPFFLAQPAQSCAWSAVLGVPPYFQRAGAAAGEQRQPGGHSLALRAGEGARGRLQHPGRDVSAAFREASHTRL